MFISKNPDKLKHEKSKNVFRVKKQDPTERNLTIASINESLDKYIKENIKFTILISLLLIFKKKNYHRCDYKELLNLLLIDFTQNKDKFILSNKDKKESPGYNTMFTDFMDEIEETIKNNEMFKDINTGKTRIIDLNIIKVAEYFFQTDSTLEICFESDDENDNNINIINTNKNNNIINFNNNIFNKKIEKENIKPIINENSINNIININNNINGKINGIKNNNINNIMKVLDDKRKEKKQKLNIVKENKLNMNMSNMNNVINSNINNDNNVNNNTIDDIISIDLNNDIVPIPMKDSSEKDKSIAHCKSERKLKKHNKKKLIGKKTIREKSPSENKENDGNQENISKLNINPNLNEQTQIIPIPIFPINNINDMNIELKPEKKIKEKKEIKRESKKIFNSIKDKDRKRENININEIKFNHDYNKAIKEQEKIKEQINEVVNMNNLNNMNNMNNIIETMIIDDDNSKENINENIKENINENIKEIKKEKVIEENLDDIINKKVENPKIENKIKNEIKVMKPKLPKRDKNEDILIIKFQEPDLYKYLEENTFEKLYKDMEKLFEKTKTKLKLF